MSTRRQTFVAVAGIDVQYEGSKSFWKTRTNVDVLIVSHPRANCLEIICYDAEKGTEAPRLYVNMSLLGTKIDHNEIENQVKEKEKKESRHKKPSNLQQFQKELIINAMNNYLITRLQMSEDISNGLKVFLISMTGDKVHDISNTLDIIMEKPKGLVPLETCFLKKASISDIRNVMNQLETEHEELRHATRLAELATMGVDGFKLMLAEKMRFESEMKRRFSPARLRWIKAINRILIQNYVAKVKVRIGWQPLPGDLEMKARPRLFQRTTEIHSPTHNHGRSSSLPTITPYNNSNNNNNRPSPLNTTDLLTSPSSPTASSSGPLPAVLSLSPTAYSPTRYSEVSSPSRRRRRRTSQEHSGKKSSSSPSNSSSSFECCHEKLVPIMTSVSSSSFDSTAATESSASSTSLAPSLIRSYNSVSQRYIPVVQVPTIIDIREHSTRALMLTKI